MQNTVFRTATLAGLFLCMLALAGAFSGITASVHAIDAGDVDTEVELEQFVKEAVDAYYIEFLLKDHCDLTQLDLPSAFDAATIAQNLGLLGFTITDLSPSSIGTLSIADIKKLIGLFNSAAVQAIFQNENKELDILGACDNTKFLSFSDFFQSTDMRWNSGSVYLFVVEYPESGEQRTIFHGQDPGLAGQNLKGLTDEDENMIMDLIEQAADGPVQCRAEAGFLDYCWDDPTIMDDNLLPDDMDPLTAPGDSWKTGYVVDPFAYLGMPPPPLSVSPRVIFGSGIYPKTGTPPVHASECNGSGVADDGEDDMDDTCPSTDGAGGAVSSGGGCAIAAGSCNTPRSSALNLLLITSALFFTVSLRGRTTDRRNGVRSGSRVFPD